MDKEKNSKRNREHKPPSYGNKAGFGIFHFLLKILGPSPAYVLLAFILPYYLLFRKSARLRASHYLKCRFPGHGKVKLFFTTANHFFEFGKVLIDQAAIGILSKERFKVDFPGGESLYAMARRNRGMVMVTSHVGNWQTAMTTMDYMEKPVNYLFEAEHNEGKHFFDLAGKRKQFKIISPKGFLGGMVECTNALKDNEVVAVMGDRAWGSKTIEMPFLGKNAKFPITPYYLSYATGADLVILLTVRTGKLAYSFRAQCISEGLDRSKISKNEAIKLLAERYVESIELFVKDYPFMWFNFYDFWSNDKEEVE